MYESKKMRNLVESVKEIMNEGKVSVPPANIMKEFETLMKKQSSSDQRKLSKFHGFLKKGEIDKALDEYENLDYDLKTNAVTGSILLFIDTHTPRIRSTAVPPSRPKKSIMKVPDNLMQEFKRKIDGIKNYAALDALNPLYDGLENEKLSWAYNWYLLMNRAYSKHVPRDLVSFMERHADVNLHIDYSRPRHLR